jgi:hypothetical protein
VPNFALTRISCGGHYSIQYANNGSTIDPSFNWLYSLSSSGNEQLITFKKQNANSLSAGIYEIKLKGEVPSSSLAAVYSSIKITVCSMLPNSLDIDVLSSNATIFYKEPYSYTVGDPVLKIPLQQFLTDAICSS